MEGLVAEFAKIVYLLALQSHATSIRNLFYRLSFKILPFEWRDFFT